MRQRLSQKTTAAYGFPMALQLFAFECVPLLLEKIHAGLSTATFLDDPAACTNPLTILTVQDLTISFAITPEEERLLLLDEVEDTQVTSLLQKLLSGETFGVEDFPGGDTSFCPKVDSAHGADQCGEENPVPNPVHRLSQRFSLLKWVYDEEMQEKMQAFLMAKTKISTQIKEMERNIRRDLGLPERIISNSRKRKAGDDNHVQTSSPESSGLKPRPNQSGKRRKTVASASVVKLIRIRCEQAAETGQLQLRDRGLKKKYPPKVALQQLWTVYPVRLSHNHWFIVFNWCTLSLIVSVRMTPVPCTPTKNPPDHALTPPTAKFDRSAAERPSTALIPYRDPLCVQPGRMCYHQRYRLSSVMARRAAPQWHGRKQTRTVIGLSEVCVHAIPHGDLNSTPKPSYGGFLVGVHMESKINRLHLQETIVPDASTGEVSGVQKPLPTDVDYSQRGGKQA
ncbi:hypothetical protein Bca52824_025736 [Brassica carinata]|uniref:Uncharacterized protein n=1 Tax=Brassica carinata TaxID=52824 RepID=A0A8X7SGQ5_BRACI|nr:hypothetical protein Bca52824_025736 [Brassica carinata]